MIAFVLLVAVASIWDYPQTLAKRPRVVNRMGMVATTCDDEPPAARPAFAVSGRPLQLTDANVTWDSDFNCFRAQVEFKNVPNDGNAGDLYMNRDGGHSKLKLEEFPGLTDVTLDAEAKRRGVDRCIQNIVFPCPTFGNSSTAFQNTPLWRSMPRSMMTNMRWTMPTMQKMYLANQVYAYPTAGDTAPVGTNGDVFASIAPYWIVTAGRSWSDLPYLKGALEVSRSLDPAVKREIVRRGMLAPVVQTLLRKSLKGVSTEADYLTAKAHPTGLPPDGLEMDRLIRQAEALTVERIPPLAKIQVEMVHVLAEQQASDECTFATDYACGVVLRSPDRFRVFRIKAMGDDEYEFVQTHGDTNAVVKIERVLNMAAISLNRAFITPTNRVDITVVGKTEKSGWGAPSYVSFAVIDEKAPYCDPTLVIRPKGR